MGGGARESARTGAAFGRMRKARGRQTRHRGPSLDQGAGDPDPMSHGRLQGQAGTGLLWKCEGSGPWTRPRVALVATSTGRRS